MGSGLFLSDDINQTVTTLKGYINEAEKRMTFKQSQIVRSKKEPCRGFIWSGKALIIFILMIPVP